MKNSQTFVNDFHQGIEINNTEQYFKTVGILRLLDCWYFKLKMLSILTNIDKKKEKELCTYSCKESVK